MCSHLQRKRQQSKRKRHQKSKVQRLRAPRSPEQPRKDARWSGLNSDRLHVAYTTPAVPGSFTAVQNLKRYSDVSYDRIKRYLSSRDAYTLHKQRRIHFPRRRTYSKGIGDLYQADLVDMTNVSRYNDSFKYLLTCVDVFSKKAWVVPLLSKSARHVTEAFEKILESGEKCNMLQTDKGSEFLNGTFQNMLKRHDIHFYTSENEDIKAAVVERFNRTLKTKMYRYFTFKNTWRYIDVLQELVDSYNGTYHRSIGMSPDEVSADNESLVRSRLYPPKSTAKKPRWRYRTGDVVRISRRKLPFAKGYTDNWTRELFKISSRLPTVPPTYALEDVSGESIKGKFYEPELQRVTQSPDQHFAIDKILKTRRGADGKVSYYVSWIGYPSKFNSWVDAIVSIA